MSLVETRVFRITEKLKTEVLFYFIHNNKKLVFFKL
jgi:hypothetical protein